MTKKITLKSKQRIINKQALDLYNMITVLKQNSIIKAEAETRLYCCTAWIKPFTDKNNKAVLYALRSYQTEVAYILFTGNTIYCIDVSRYVYGYTATTAQHVRKFFNLFQNNYPYYYKNNNYIELIYKPC